MVAQRAKYLRKLKERQIMKLFTLMNHTSMPTTLVTKNGNRVMGRNKEIFHLEKEKE